MTCPTGDLVVVDFGLLRLWSGDEPPVLDADDVGPDVAARANASVDYEIVGPDAPRVAAAIDLAAVKGRFGFDLPADDGFVAQRVADVCRAEGLDAQVEPVERMPHRQRLERLLDDEPAGVEVPFHGGWAVALRGLPRDRALQISGARMDPDGPDAGRWHSVWVTCDERPPVRSMEAGLVLVDEARLLFADPAALNQWTSDLTLDGLADVAFWGRDAPEVAAAVGAGLLPGSDDSEAFGWVDRPVEEVLHRVTELEDFKRDGAHRFAVDFRPHDDHHRLLSQARRAPTEAGTIEVGGATMTGFFTSWGDGAFPVFREEAADGALCRVRVELGGPEIVQRARRMEELWFGELSKMAVVSAAVAREDRPVRWMYREAPDRDADSGWRVFSGDESQDYLDESANAAIVPLRELIEADPALEQFFRSPAPIAYERASPEEPFSEVEPPDTT